MSYIVNPSQQNWKFLKRNQSQAKVARLSHLDLHSLQHLLLPLLQEEGLQILSQQIKMWCFLTQINHLFYLQLLMSMLSLYNLPSFQFLHQLLEYLYSEHGLLLRPVSNILLSFAVIVFLLWGFRWGFTGHRYRIMWSSGPLYKVVTTGAVVVGSLSATFCAFSFAAFCTIANCKLCHFCAIYWPCTKFLAFTMNCLFIILPNCKL